MKILLILLFFPLVVLSQAEWKSIEAKEFMELIREYEKSIPAGENYSLETKYRIFNDVKDLEPAVSFDGKLVCKNGKELNVYQMGQLMIQDATINITVDTAGKQLMVQAADPAFFYRKTVADYTTFLEMAEGVSVRSLNGADVYLLRLKKGSPYQSMEFTFPERNFISRIVIFSNQPYYSENTDYSSAKAKIVIDFEKTKKGKAVSLHSFVTVKDCIVIKDEIIIPTEKYKDFEVIDLRN